MGGHAWDSIPPLLMGVSPIDSALFEDEEKTKY